MFVGIYGNLYIEKLNPIENEHLTWGDIRRDALDCQPVPFDQKKFDKYNISKEQYWAMYNVFYYDYSHLTIDDFKGMIQLNDWHNKYNFHIKAILKQWKSQLSTGVKWWSNIHIWLFLLTLCIFLVASKKNGDKKWMYGVGIFIITILCTLIFYVIQRAIYRVVMPNFVFASLLLIQKTDWNFSNSKALSYLVKIISVSVVIFVLFTRITHYDMFDKHFFMDKRREVLSYIKDHNDIIYMTGDVMVYSLAEGRSIWDYTAENSYWNIMGNWEIYGDAYYKLMKIYNVRNPNNLLLESVDNDKILILTTRGEDFSEHGKPILSWLKRYYNIDADFKKVDDVHKLISGNYKETWVTYKIVRKIHK